MSIPSGSAEAGPSVISIDLSIGGDVDSSTPSSEVIDPPPTDLTDVLIHPLLERWGSYVAQRLKIDKIRSKCFKDEGDGRRSLPATAPAGGTKAPEIIYEGEDDDDDEEYEPLSPPPPAPSSELASMTGVDLDPRRTEVVRCLRKAIRKKHKKDQRLRSFGAWFQKNRLCRDRDCDGDGDDGLRHIDEAILNDGRLGRVELSVDELVEWAASDWADDPPIGGGSEKSVVVSSNPIRFFLSPTPPLSASVLVASTRTRLTDASDRLWFLTGHQWHPDFVTSSDQASRHMIELVRRHGSRLSGQKVELASMTGSSSSSSPPTDCLPSEPSYMGIVRRYVGAPQNAEHYALLYGSCPRAIGGPQDLSLQHLWAHPDLTSSSSSGDDDARVRPIQKIEIGSQRLESMWLRRVDLYRQYLDFRASSNRRAMRRLRLVGPREHLYRLPSFDKSQLFDEWANRQDDYRHATLSGIDHLADQIYDHCGRMSQFMHALMLSSALIPFDEAPDAPDRIDSASQARQRRQDHARAFRQAYRMARQRANAFYRVMIKHTQATLMAIDLLAVLYRGGDDVRDDDDRRALYDALQSLTFPRAASSDFAQNLTRLVSDSIQVFREAHRRQNRSQVVDRLLDNIHAAAQRFHLSLFQRPVVASIYSLQSSSSSSSTSGESGWAVALLSAGSSSSGQTLNRIERRVQNLARRLGRSMDEGYRLKDPSSSSRSDRPTDLTAVLISIRIDPKSSKKLPRSARSFYFYRIVAGDASSATTTSTTSVSSDVESRALQGQSIESSSSSSTPTKTSSELPDFDSTAQESSRKAAAQAYRLMNQYDDECATIVRKYVGQYCRNQRQCVSSSPASAGGGGDGGSIWATRGHSMIPGVVDRLVDCYSPIGMRSIHGCVGIDRTRGDQHPGHRYDSVVPCEHVVAYLCGLTASSAGRQRLNQASMPPLERPCIYCRQRDFWDQAPSEVPGLIDRAQDALALVYYVAAYASVDMRRQWRPAHLLHPSMLLGDLERQDLGDVQRWQCPGVDLLNDDEATSSLRVYRHLLRQGVIQKSTSDGDGTVCLSDYADTIMMGYSLAAWHDADDRHRLANLIAEASRYPPSIRSAILFAGRPYEPAAQMAVVAPSKSAGDRMGETLSATTTTTTELDSRELRRVYQSFRQWVADLARSEASADYGPDVIGFLKWYGRHAVPIINGYCRRRRKCRSTQSSSMSRDECVRQFGRGASRINRIVDTVLMMVRADYPSTTEPADSSIVLGELERTLDMYLASMDDRSLSELATFYDIVSERLDCIDQALYRRMRGDESESDDDDDDDEGDELEAGGVQMIEYDRLFRDYLRTTGLGPIGSATSSGGDVDDWSEATIPYNGTEFRRQSKLYLRWLLETVYADRLPSMTALRVLGRGEDSADDGSVHWSWGSGEAWHQASQSIDGSGWKVSDLMTVEAMGRFLVALRLVVLRHVPRLNFRGVDVMTFSRAAEALQALESLIIQSIIVEQSSSDDSRRRRYVQAPPPLWSTLIQVAAGSSMSDRSLRLIARFCDQQTLIQIKWRHLQDLWQLRGHRRRKRAGCSACQASSSSSS